MGKWEVGTLLFAHLRAGNLPAFLHSLSTFLPTVYLPPSPLAFAAFLARHSSLFTHHFH